MLLTESTKPEIQCYKWRIRRNGRVQGSTIELPEGDVLLKGRREKKHEGITEVVKPFDWSYSTDYKGTEHSKSTIFEPSDTAIPLELLRRPDPIIFFDEVMLYEDEMADNGITLLSCKLRAMPARLLLLCRFFMRLDGVMLRIRDTRVYVDFESGEVIREYTAREDKYEVIRQVRSGAGATKLSLLISHRSWQCKEETRQHN